MNYIAYTIGPIYETIFKSLSDDHKTKRLQAGSAFFSNFMRELLLSIREDFEILVPYTGEDALREQQRMGLFHDRFIAVSSKSREEIRRIFEERLDETMHRMTEGLAGENLPKLLAEQMQNHLLIASREELQKIDENVIFAINKILDAKELQRNFELELPKVDLIGEYQQKHIATSRVKSIEEISVDVGISYYAVIAADGDKMGAKIREMATDDPQRIADISKSLYNFFTSYDEEDGGDLHDLLVEKYGGILIYAGGDDILAMLPVKYGERTFLDAIEALDARFGRHVGKDVSLSFGVNIAYYKYPMRDAVTKAFDLLYSAKNFAPNSVALRLVKHSGQWFETILQLQSETYRTYKRLINGILIEKAVAQGYVASNDVERLALPHAFHHTLKRYEAAISQTVDSQRSLEPLFEHIFDDVRVHEEKEGIKMARRFIELYKPTSQSAFDGLFLALGIIKFLREDRR